MCEKWDRLELCGLEVFCVIGDLPQERDREQALKVDVELRLDLRPAGASDRLKDTVDYAALAEAVRTSLRQARFHMIEAAAQRVAEVCLLDRRVAAVRVRVEKRGAVSGLQAAAVVLTRERPEAQS